MKKFLIVIVAMAELLLSSCSQFGEAHLPTAETVGRDGYGACIGVYLKPDDQVVVGELLALSPDTVYLVTQQPFPRFVSFARDTVDGIDGSFYRRTNFGALAGAVAIGGSLASILTTGWYSILLLIPMYILGAIIGTNAASGTSQIGYDSFDKNAEFEWSDLRAYARFPTKLPPTFNRAKAGTKY